MGQVARARLARPGPAGQAAHRRQLLLPGLAGPAGRDWANPLDSSSSYIANVGKSTSYGAELELTYQATARLELFGSLGLLKTEFDEFQIGETDFSGLPFPGAPEHTVVLGYVWGADTGFFTSGNLKYVGSFMSRLDPAWPGR